MHPKEIHTELQECACSIVYNSKTTGHNLGVEHSRTRITINALEYFQVVQRERRGLCWQLHKSHITLVPPSNKHPQARDSVLGAVRGRGDM